MLQLKSQSGICGRTGKSLSVLVALAAMALLLWRAPNGVETDLHGMTDSRHGGVLKEIANGMAGQGRVLLEGDDVEALARSAAEIAAEFHQRPAGELKEMLQQLDSRKSGLLSAATRELLQAGKYHEVAESSAARLFGVAPPLFSVKSDPFLLASDWLESLQDNLGEGWSLHDGYPVRERESRVYLLMTLELGKFSSDQVVDFLHRCERQDGTDGKERRWCGGAPFHSALASLRSRREIGMLSMISIAMVVGLGWMLFRSFRFVPWLLLAQGCGFLIATAALFAVFPRPHVLTFVFGTSLIGLSVDYVYHVHAVRGERRVLRPLTLSLITTLACFSPLLFADVVMLRQMALFTIVGLLAVYGMVVLWGIDGEGTSGARAASDRGRAATGGRKWWLVIGGLVLICGGGLWRIEVVDDPVQFYRPDPWLVSGEKRILELSPGQTGRFAFVPGDTLQEALEKEEQAGLRGLSAIVPSLKRQRENAGLIAKLVAAEGSNYTARTGLKMAAAADGFLDPEQLQEGALGQLVRSMRVAGGLISPIYSDRGPQVAGPGWTIVSPRTALQALFRDFTRSTVRMLVVSLVAFAVLLMALLRGACLRTGAPVVMALVATAGVMGWCGIPVTFFTLLCFFVLAGLGIDYSIFHAGGADSGTRRTVGFAFLTSFVGLGMLAFTDFPVTRSMGITLAVGLAFAYGFSRLLNPVEADGASESGSGRRDDRGGAMAWHEQGEQSAGAFRLGFMWWSYVWLGKSVLKLVSIPVVACIYPFAVPARRALRAFYRVLGVEPTDWMLFRHLLGFAWSLADKTDACTLQKNLPRMSVVEDGEWREFCELVSARRGAFLISTHLGTIEVLPALAASHTGSVVLPEPTPRVHAFQQLGHNAAFTRLFMRHFNARAFTMHAVEDIGVETAVEMQQAIGRGELVLMAGDRVSAGSAKTLEHDFLGKGCRWPKGVFTFAKLMESPVFFVSCVRIGWNAYECRVRRFRDSSDGHGGGVVARMLDQYVTMLEAETRRHPEQWYHFHDFFGNMV